jgi:hypothetical protein
MAWLTRLQEAQAATQKAGDPWLLPLGRVLGKADYDGMERVSTQTLLDLLEVAQRNRSAGTCRRLAKLMAELGWTAVRVPGPDPGRLQGAGPGLLPGRSRSVRFRPPE